MSVLLDKVIGACLEKKAQYMFGPGRPASRAVGPSRPSAQPVQGRMPVVPAVGPSRASAQRALGMTPASRAVGPSRASAQPVQPGRYGTSGGVNFDDPAQREAWVRQHYGMGSAAAPRARTDRPRAAAVSTWNKPQMGRFRSEAMNNPVLLEDFAAGARPASWYKANSGVENERIRELSAFSRRGR